MVKLTSDSFRKTRSPLRISSTGLLLAVSLVALCLMLPALHVIVLTNPSSSKSFDLAYKESFGFFDYIEDSDWKYRQQVARTRRDHKRDGTKTENSKRWYLSNYYPAFSCPNLLRLHRIPGDGPKYVCDPHRLPAIAKKRMETDKNAGCLVYSVGSRGKFEFEDGLIDLIGPVCEIHVFDPANYTRPGMEKQNMHFHKWGITASDGSYHPKGMNWAKFMTMQETVKRLGHENRVIDIMKIDCEYCEWVSYKDWLDPLIDFRQLLVETHDSPPNANEFFDGFLNAGYMIFSKEPNIHPNALQDENGMGVEWSFIKLHPSFSQPANPGGKIVLD